MITDKLKWEDEEDVFIFPASFAQQRLWFIEQLLPEKSLYVIPLVWRLTGSLMRSHLQQSMRAIVHRHEILRTSFDRVDGQLVQVIVSKLEVTLKLTDLRALPANTREETALTQIQQIIQQPFQLDKSPLFRFQLWQLDDSDHLLLMALHHIIFDEWSSGVLIRELGELYTAAVEDRPASLPELPLQYADFAHWQRKWLQGEVLNEQLSYWKQQLKDVPMLNLPGVASRSSVHNHQGSSQLLELPQGLLDALEELSQHSGVTLFMTLLAAFGTLLHRYTGQTDLAIGSPIANRHHSELEGLIGFLVNSLVLRTNLAGDPTFRELLERVRDVTLAAYAHQDLPFEKLVEELQPIRSPSQNPLFQVVFALQNTPMEQLTLPGLVLSPVEFDTKTTRFDLELYVWKCTDNFRNLWGKGWQQSNGLRGVIVYNTDLFDRTTITSLRKHFQTLLEGIVANPDTHLSALPLLKIEEQKKLFQHWSGNQSNYPSNVCIHQLFEAQVKQRPTEIAVQFGDAEGTLRARSFTYQELNQGSNQLARYLQRLGICSQMSVGICLERSAEAIAAMLAVLKAGGAYVPLDPSFPPERLHFMLLDAGISVVLTQENWVDLLQTDRIQVICLDREWSEIAQESDENLSISPTAAQLAYIIYTSGSTGTPKGVMIPHKAVNRLVCEANYIQIEPNDRIAQVANLAFDAATFEVWGALLNGARLVGIEREITLSPTHFVTELQQQQISILFVTTALFNQTVSQIPDAFHSLKYLLFGGEMVNIDWVRSLLNQVKPKHLIHVYGPTENTTFSTWYEIESIPENATTIPIGQAITNTQAYLLDANLNPVPAGVIGEIYLSGDGLAQGYLNRPQLTAEKFIHSDFSVLYKTGDQALYRLDGNLEFLGRTDDQIKIRGFRVELGEIETVIAQHPTVQTAVVLVREIESNLQLIAYIIPKSSAIPTERDLRSFLKTKLPAYMVPAAFVVLDTLPLTANGKVDRQALPFPNLIVPKETSLMVAPTNSLEASLAELWTHLLGREQVGIHDNFFELGGHSLLATQFVSRIRNRFGVELPLRSVFEAPTISQLAQKIEALGGRSEAVVQEEGVTVQTQYIASVQELRGTSEVVVRGMVFPLSFAQQRLWFLYQLAPNNPFYNVPAAIRLKGTLNRTALERSFQEIVRRHAALRTTFTTLDGKPVQAIKSDVKIQVSVVDLPTVAISERERISQQLATAEAQRPFNLTTDLLLRVTVLQFEPTEAVLLLTMHHIVADGWSLGVLIRELACCYTAFVKGRTPALLPLPIQYTDFACWQRNWLQGEVLEQQLTYWRKQLQNLPVLNLPRDRPRSTVQTYRGATYPIQISLSLTQAFEALSQRSGVSLFMTLLAAFQTLLYRYTGQEDIAIGCPIANRHRTEVEPLIGFFVNSLVMRSDLSGNPTFRQLLDRVRTVALEAYEHQDLPFEKLVEELDPERDLSRNPLFQVAFALQNAPMQPLELPGLMLEPAPLSSGSTRFDLELHLWEPAHGLGSLWQSEEGLSGFISYSTDLFDRSRIARLVGHFLTLLEGIIINPDTRLSELPLLTSAEQQQILVEWNQTTTNPRNPRCFPQIFDEWVRSNPKAIAIVSEQGTLTYRELNQQAQRLAQILIQMGVGTDSSVGLCVDRSAEMVIGILGILKAGAAYVPLDPNYPSDRLHFMSTDTGVSILLTQSWLVAKLPQSQAQVICLDRSLLMDGELAGSQSTSIEDTVTFDGLAYIIYTSGSTGKPKGVLLTHRGLCNVVEAQQQIFHPSCKSRVLQFSSLSFDASIFEIALALGSGGTLYIPPKSAQLPGMELVQFLKNNAITHALLTPAVLAVLPFAELPKLQVLITGGEACSSQVVDRWAKNRHFFNAYGPTESTIWATVTQLQPGDPPLTIGRPILNTQVYILDDQLNPVPVGIPGELYIGGAGVAQGYLNRPELTAQRFIYFELPIGGLKSKTIRLYKTGDRVQYRTDGTIEFLGRVDNQIKIRGFRVELGEIEATLQSHPAIRDAVVIPLNEMRLTAYFSIDRQYLQQTLSQSLQNQHIQQWQTLYNQTYRSTDGTPNFDITGWNSSYTGEPIPLEQMQEWVSDRIGQILALKPKRVLEIGCGTGLLLFQIAPHTQKYLATDFSLVALESIQNQLQVFNLPHVELLQRMATDFEGIAPASFDVVILNSIVQYFPSVDYLMQVLEGAIETVTDGGVLFLGDIRSLPLLKAFQTWVQFGRADAGMERTQLQQKVDRSCFEDPELAIDPAFFQALRQKFPQIRQVQIRLSRGRSQNEMTQFRYNVLLYIGQCTDSNQDSSHLIQQHNWKLNPITVKELQKKLIETKPKIFRLTNVTNSRVHAALRTVNWLNNQETPTTVGRMRDVLQDSAEMAINPQDWLDLETVLPYKVEITWSTQTQTGDYDVVLIGHDVDLIIDTFICEQLDQSWHLYTNAPLQSPFARQLIPQLRQYLRQTLPDYMIPSAFVPLETLPLTANGKVDRHALPTLEEDTIAPSSRTNTPSTPEDTDLEVVRGGMRNSLPHLDPVPNCEMSVTESTLIEIWQELLRLKQVNPHDNFFELGGHSLLATQMTSRVRDVFGLELPLKSVFEAPTIAQLAPILESLRDTTSTPKILPLVRLDRSAYRRGRITLPNDNSQSLPDFERASLFLNKSASPLVLLTPGSSKQPFFCVHPLFGVVFPYLELAQQLNSDRSFYGLQPLGLDGKSPPLNRIEAIAAYYIQAIQSLQPQGPYFIGGWSFGGIVAFEMAQQLTQAGQQIGLLAILDTPAPISRKPSLSQNLQFLLGTALWSSLPFLQDYGAIVSERLQSWNPWFSRWQWSAIARLIPEESRLRLLNESALKPMLRIVHANIQATYRYVPQPYSHTITLFKAVEQSDAIGQDSILGWEALAKNIQLYQVSGNHLSLLKQPHVQTLAQQLGQILSS